MLQWQWDTLPRPSWTVESYSNFVPVILQDGYIMTFTTKRNQRAPCGNRTHVYGSGDCGNSWEQFPDAPGVARTIIGRDSRVQNPDEIDSLLVSVLNDGSLLLLDTNGRAAYHSIDRACTWTALPDPKWSRRHGSSIGVLVGGEVLLVGGVSSDDETHLAEIWSSADGGNSWRPLPNPPWEGRRDASIAELADGTLILVGGTGGRSWSRPLQESWRSNRDWTHWSMMPSPPTSVRTWITMAPLPNGSLLLIGSESADAWILDLGRSAELSSWSQLPHPPWPPRKRVAALCHYDCLLLIGVGRSEPIPRLLKLMQIPVDILRVSAPLSNSCLQVTVTQDNGQEIYIFTMDSDSRFLELKQRIAKEHQKPYKLLLPNGTDLTNLKETYLVQMLDKIGNSLPVWKKGSRVRLSSDSEYAHQCTELGTVMEDIWLGCGYGRIDFDGGDSNNYRYEDLEGCPREGDWFGISIEPSMRGIDEARTRGNELFARGAYADAEKWYSKSMWLLETRQVKHMDKHLPCHCSNKLLSTLYSNRALLHLSTRSWIEANADSTKALSLDSENLKAKHRRAIAEFELGDRNASLQDVNEILEKLPDGQAKRELIELKRRIQVEGNRATEELPKPPEKRVKVLPPVPTFSGDLSRGSL